MKEWQAAPPLGSDYLVILDFFLRKTQGQEALLQALFLEPPQGYISA